MRKVRRREDAGVSDIGPRSEDFHKNSEGLNLVRDIT